jgi:hypothetical protein
VRIRLLSSLILLVIAGPVYSQSSNQSAPVGFMDVVVPADLAPGTDAIVLAAGLLSPKGCQKWDSYSVVHESEFVHEVTAKAATKPFCIGLITEFVEKINLGKLSPGTHTLRYLDGHLKLAEKTFEVQEPARKSYLMRYCPSHPNDHYCMTFTAFLPSKAKCCQEVANNLSPELRIEYAPTWYAKKFGYPVELFDRCVLGPVEGGVAYCD